MKLVYHPFATREVVEAAQFYEGRSPGLGEQFLIQVDEAAQALLRDPYRWPALDAGIHRIMLKRFPFGIYFRILDDTVRVLTVKHHRRHPGYGIARQ